MNQYLLPLEKNERLNPVTHLHTYRHPDIARLASPGQFVSVRASLGTDPLLRRPFSFCTADRETGRFTILIKVIGPGTRLLADMAPGTKVDMLAPLGHSFQWKGAKRLLLIAGGVGVAPLLFLAREVHETYPDCRAGQRSEVRPEIIFCYGARTAAEFVLLDQIERVVDRLILTTDDGSQGAREFVTQAAERFFEPHVSIFTCGPNPMMNDLLKRMRRAGLEGQASLENQMGCSIGACLGCVVTTRKGYRRVCCEGPVMPTEIFETIG